MTLRDLAQSLFLMGFKRGTAEDAAAKADVNRDGNISPAEQARVQQALESVKAQLASSKRMKLVKWISSQVSTGDNYTLGTQPNAIGQALGWIAPSPDKMLNQALDAAVVKAKK
jgi:hypothetical protein